MFLTTWTAVLGLKFFFNLSTGGVMRSLLGATGMGEKERFRQLFNKGDDRRFDVAPSEETKARPDDVNVPL